MFDYTIAAGQRLPPEAGGSSVQVGSPRQSPPEYRF